MTAPDPSPILELIDAFRRSKTMFAAVSLGVFECIAGAPATAPEIASRIFGPAAPVEPLSRLLDACVGMGLLQLQEGSYRNTPLTAAYLCDAGPLSLTGYVRYSNEALFPMWAHLEDALQEAAPRWKQTFGWEGPLFDHFFKTPERRRSFLRGMHGFGQLSSARIVAAFDLSRFHAMADLGGATGHLAIAACETYPQLRATIFDLPVVTDMAREYVERSPARERLRIQAGDFFRDDLPPAQLYVLGRVLHDWGEDRIRFLLRKICAALPPGGALLIAEKLLAEDRSGPTHVHMQSLNMLICTEGRERTLGEYRALLLDSGFQSAEGKLTGTLVDAVLARKAEGQ